MTEVVPSTVPERRVFKRGETRRHEHSHSRERGGSSCLRVFVVKAGCVRSQEQRCQRCGKPLKMSPKIAKKDACLVEVRRRTQVAKGEVCKTFMQRFESARRLQPLLTRVSRPTMLQGSRRLRAQRAGLRGLGEMARTVTVM